MHNTQCQGYGSSYGSYAVTKCTGRGRNKGLICIIHNAKDMALVMVVMLLQNVPVEEGTKV